MVHPNTTVEDVCGTEMAIGCATIKGSATHSQSARKGGDESSKMKANEFCRFQLVFLNFDLCRPTAVSLLALHEISVCTFTNVDNNDFDLTRPRDY